MKHINEPHLYNNTMVKVAILKVHYNVYEVEGDLVISRAMS